MMSNKNKTIVSEFERVLFKVWPPFELFKTNKIIMSNIGSQEEMWEEAISEVRDALPSTGAIIEVLERYKDSIKAAEKERKETIENKASTFMVGIGLSLSVVAFVVNWPGSAEPTVKILGNIATVAFVLAIIHLLVAVYYAVKVRAVSEYAIPSIKELKELANDEANIREEMLVFALAQAKWNDHAILSKANTLSVVESLFLHGLALVAFAVLLTILSKTML